MSSASIPAPTVLIDELASLPERIRVAAQRVRDLTSQIALERRTRDRLIVDAVDQAGMPQSQVARYAGLSQPHVVRILSTDSGDDE